MGHRMRSLVLGSLLLAALAAMPAAHAEVFADVDGKWFFTTEGHVRVIPGNAVPARGVVFVDDEGSYFWRVTFDPLQRVFLQCQDGAGFASVSGVNFGLDACSLTLQGAFAIPRGSLTQDVGQLPGPLGAYLGDIAVGLSGSGSFRIA